MDSESFDSGQNYHSVDGDQPDPDILSEFDWGSAQGGSRAGGSGLSQALGASARVSILSIASYHVPPVIGRQTITPTSNYFNNTNWRSHGDITARMVVCPKGKRGAQGSCD
jgi:hypothetical protein